MPNTHRPDDNGQRGSEPGWRNTLRRPTFWVLMVALAMFLYLQWPTRTKPVDSPDYVTREVFDGVYLEWEAPPERRDGEAGPLWTLSRKGMEFIAQRGPLNRPFTELAQHMLEADRRQVSGAVFKPLTVEQGEATYALFDAANRVQRHRLFRLDGHWLKVSVLHKAQNDTHEARAQHFLNSVQISPD